MGRGSAGAARGLVMLPLDPTLLAAQGAEQARTRAAWSSDTHASVPLGLYPRHWQGEPVAKTSLVAGSGRRTELQIPASSLESTHIRLHDLLEQVSEEPGHPLGSVQLARLEAADVRGRSLVPATHFAARPSLEDRRETLPLETLADLAAAHREGLALFSGWQLADQQLMRNYDPRELVISRRSLA